MSLNRRNPRRDASEPAIVQALRATGWRVDFLSGRNLPDLLISGRGVTILAEVKTGKAKLRKGQAEMADGWRGGPYLVLRSVDEALALNKWMNQ